MIKSAILLGTVWVCQCCALSHANGECCADDTHGGDGIAPWSLVDDARYSVTAGLLWEEHHEECPNHQAGEWVDECDCEDLGFSWSSCDGCGSTLGGTRRAHALWRERQRFPKRTVALP